ncbi:response regulator [Arcobacter roscoffensis]|uniref:Response regulator n=1 Tax=Arcobacter roscoffensis TaxID=2961520 RepID=A0ABY5E881_9BACT|nr:response regulator [Arcobacter roscoffensis]UTJ07872.1 response regulator [Arcobacter roscoffensis]
MKKFTILIIDDIEDNIYTLKFLLNSNFEDLQILEANSAKDAIFLIMQNDVDLILSDIQMPEIDGFELVEYLQSVPSTSQIPIVLITGIYHDDIYKKRAFSLSNEVVDFISKPIDDEILCQKLRVYIKIFEEKKITKENLLQKDRLIKDHNKVNSMLDNLDNINEDLQGIIKHSDEYKKLMEEEDLLIDLEEVVAKNKS